MVEEFRAERADPTALLVKLAKAEKAAQKENDHEGARGRESRRVGSAVQHR